MSRYINKFCESAGINGHLGTNGIPNETHEFWSQLSSKLGNIHKTTYFVLQGGPNFSQSKICNSFTQAFPDWDIIERFFVPATKAVDEPEQVSTDYRPSKSKMMML